MSDDPIYISVRYPLPGGPNANGRVYPADVFKKAMQKAVQDGSLKVSVGGTQQPHLKGKPITFGDRRFIDPKMQIERMDIMGPDGELQAVIRVEEQASAVDQLAAVLEEGIPAYPPGISSVSTRDASRGS